MLVFLKYDRSGADRCNFLIVGYDDDRGTILIQVFQDLKNLVLGVGIESAGRLVCEDDAGTADYGSGYGDALFLATRQDERRFRFQAGYSQTFHDLKGFLFLLA